MSWKLVIGWFLYETQFSLSNVRPVVRNLGLTLENPGRGGIVADSKAIVLEPLDAEMPRKTLDALQFILWAAHRKTVFTFWRNSAISLPLNFSRSRIHYRVTFIKKIFEAVYKLYPNLHLSTALQNWIQLYIEYFIIFR